MDGAGIEIIVERDCIVTRDTEYWYVFAKSTVVNSIYPSHFLAFLSMTSLSPCRAFISSILSVIFRNLFILDL